MRGIENSRQVRFLIVGGGVLLLLILMIAYQLGAFDVGETTTTVPYVNATQMAEADSSATAVEHARATKTQAAVLQLTMTPDSRGGD